LRVAGLAHNGDGFTPAGCLGREDLWNLRYRTCCATVPRTDKKRPRAA
jgi:hypothetical protein